MNTRIVAGKNINPYIPSYLSEDKKWKIHQLCQDIVTLVGAWLPAAISYNNTPRIIRPASVFLQDQSPRVVRRITDRAKGYPHKMTVINGWARRAVGIDAIEEESWNSGGGWKTYHLDQIDDHRLLTFDEIKKAFPYTEEDETYFYQPQSQVEGFVRNWNYWFRIFLAQAESEHDLLDHMWLRK